MPYNADGTYYLSITQIEQFEQQAGIPGSLIPTLAAIADAESSGNPLASGPFGEQGLYQVYPAAHPDLAAKYNLFDPFQNTEAIVYPRFQTGLDANIASGDIRYPWSGRGKVPSTWAGPHSSRGRPDSATAVAAAMPNRRSQRTGGCPDDQQEG
jgi:hypothetical protein